MMREISEIKVASEPWMVWFYNELDADFGYDAGPQVFRNGLDPSVAKSIARHYNSASPEFVHYWAEEEPVRFV